MAPSSAEPVTPPSIELRLNANLDHAAALAVCICRNHPLIGGNKRLAWSCLTMFCAPYGRRLHVPTEEAVTAMLAVAAGDLDEVRLAQWLAVWVDQSV